MVIASRALSLSDLPPAEPSAAGIALLHEQLGALRALRLIRQRLAWVARRADLDGDGELTFNDGQCAYSRVAPLVRRHPALTGGVVCGFVGAYGALR